MMVLVMKKLFILMSLIVQLFGVSNLKYDIAIHNEKELLVKQILKCKKEVRNYKNYGNPQKFLRSQKIQNLPLNSPTPLPSPTLQDTSHSSPHTQLQPF